MPLPDWLAVPIGSLCEAIYDGPHATPKKMPTGPVFLGISSLSRGRLDLSAVEHLSEDDFRAWTRRVTPRAGDVVFSYETRLGEAALIPDGLRCCLGRRMALMRPDPSRVDGRFLLYAYLAPQFQEVIRSRTIHGSTVDRILLVDFPSFPICVPPLAEQKAISDILGALDDKIDLNRRMNETLEAMARALFKSWFVDFDPVRAKTEGQQPSGMDAEIAALFPDNLIQTRIGPVPTGWPTVPLADHAEVMRGLSYSGAGLGGDLPLHNLNSVFEGGGYKYEGIKWYAGEYRERHIVRAGDPAKLRLKPTRESRRRAIPG
jgi:type I restriction enzyme S subunit